MGLFTSVSGVKHSVYRMEDCMLKTLNSNGMGAEPRVLIDFQYVLPPPYPIVDSYGVIKELSSSGEWVEGSLNRSQCPWMEL
jgi:hypothetical protein